LQNPTTLGEKIRNRRLEKEMLQKDLARLIGVSQDCVTFWENNRSQPGVNYYPKIIQFLEYFPFQIDTKTLAGRIKMYRFVNGLSQEALANLLEVDESTIYHYEKGSHKPNGKLRLKLQALLSTIGFDI